MFKKIIGLYKKIGYDIDIFGHKVNSFAYHFHCTTEGRASD